MKPAISRMPNGQCMFEMDHRVVSIGGTPMIVKMKDHVIGIKGDKLGDKWRSRFCQRN